MQLTEKESMTDAVGTSFDLFDALAEAVFLLDDEGRITSANAAADAAVDSSLLSVDAPI